MRWYLILTWNYIKHLLEFTISCFCLNYFYRQVIVHWIFSSYHSLIIFQGVMFLLQAYLPWKLMQYFVNGVQYRQIQGLYQVQDGALPSNRKWLPLWFYRRLFEEVLQFWVIICTNGIRFNNKDDKDFKPDRWWMVRLYGISNGSLCFRYLAISLFGILKVTVSLRYQWQRFCDISIWSIKWVIWVPVVTSFRYLKYFQSQLGTSWYVTTTSQIGRFYQGVIYKDVDV